MSSYPYIGQLAPAVGGGLGGLPRRNQITQSKTSSGYFPVENTKALVLWGNNGGADYARIPADLKPSAKASALNSLGGYRTTAAISGLPNIATSTGGGVISKDGKYFARYTQGVGLYFFSYNYLTKSATLLYSETTTAASVQDITVSDDGVYWAVAMSDPSYGGVFVYKRVGDTFTKLSNAQVPYGGRYCQWSSISPDGSTLLFVLDGASFNVNAYKRSGDSFSSMTVSPAVLGWANGVWSYDGKYVLLGSGTEIRVYSVVGTVLTQVASLLETFGGTSGGFWLAEDNTLFFINGKLFSFNGGVIATIGTLAIGATSNGRYTGNVKAGLFCSEDSGLYYVDKTTYPPTASKINQSLVPTPTGRKMCIYLPDEEVVL